MAFIFNKVLFSLSNPLKNSPFYSYFKYYIKLCTYATGWPHLRVEGGYQCLTCNKVVSNTEICKHLDSEQHKVARVSLGCTRNDADNNQPNIDQINEEKKEQTTENEAHGDDTQATSSKNVDTEVLSDNSSVTEGKAIKKPTAVSIELETYANKHGLIVTQDRFSLNCQIESLYHCGFCGVFQKEFGSILDHLNTALHEHQKDTKKKILQRIKDEGLLNHHSTKEINIFERFLALSEY
ncbi:unnamed protein product [Arctia plantaginis]|uniref:Uncharacterized protein n=1 Tax=Arctia plantaginis TaxID=874455 RepID=A0A8S0ZFL5_ARCPL|nr:unnamed protein product [Arctia plantaginis]